MRVVVGFLKGTSKTLILSATAFLLCSCVNELPAINDRIDVSARVVGIEPTTTVVGSSVEVAIEGSLSFSEMSWLATQNVADVLLGVCFVQEVTDELLLDPQGLCSRSSNTLSSRYRLLDGTSHFKSVGDVVIQRGVEFTFDHSFKFTMDVADDAFLQVAVFFQPEGYDLPIGGGSEGWVPVTFTAR